MSLTNPGLPALVFLLHIFIKSSMRRYEAECVFLTIGFEYPSFFWGAPSNFEYAPILHYWHGIYNRMHAYMQTHYSFSIYFS